MNNKKNELLEAPISLNEVEQSKLYLNLQEKIESLDSVNDILSNYVVKILNSIIRNIFVPQMQEMLQKYGLHLQEKNIDYDWVQSSWAGFTITKENWEHFVIGIEFEKRWLKSPIIGFLKKKDFNRNNNEELWTILQEKLNVKDKKNTSWIYKNFEGLQDWHTNEAVKQLSDGRIVSDFEKMIKELLQAAELVENEGFKL